MLGKIQGVTPEIFHVINRDGEEIAYQYNKYEGMLLEAIEGTRKILEKKNMSLQPMEVVDFHGRIIAIGLLKKQMTYRL